MDRLRDSLKNRRHCKLNRDEETCTHKISRSRRFQKKYKKNANQRQRRKVRKVEYLNTKMANVKNFSSVELNDNQKRALCLGQGFAVSKPFHLGNFLEDWNKLKNKIRWRMFFRNNNSNSVIHPYRKSTGRRAPVGSDYDSKLVKNFLFSCEKQFLSKAWFPLVLRIVRIRDSYEFPTLGFLQLLRFLGQLGSHSSEESQTARGIYL